MGSYRFHQNLGYQNLEQKDHFDGLGIKGMIILKWIPERWHGTV
jgi:hypothetical protein